MSDKYMTQHESPEDLIVKYEIDTANGRFEIQCRVDEDRIIAFNYFQRGQ